MKKLVAGAFGAVLLLTPVATNAVQASPSSTATIRCKNQTLGSGTLVTGNIEVPSGAFCDLNGAHVTGNATVETKGGLALDLAAAIDGDVRIAPRASLRPGVARPSVAT